MKKKLMIALLLPLMMLPMVAFAYAHWTDSVRKDYYLHAGTVKVEIVWFHVEGTNTYDADCDGEIYGDELQIIEVREYDEELEEWETKKLSIIVDPIYPSWYLDLEVIVHNKGRLAVKADEPVFRWTGPQENMLDDIDTPLMYMDNATGIPLYFQYEWHYYVWREGVGWFEVQPTTMVIKPSEVLRVKQFIHFIGQDFPELQCHWLDLHVEIPFFQYIGEEEASWPAGPYVP